MLPVLSNVKSVVALIKDVTFGLFSDAVFDNDGASGAFRFLRAMLWPISD